MGMTMGREVSEAGVSHTVVYILVDVHFEAHDRVDLAELSLVCGICQQDISVGNLYDLSAWWVAYPLPA